MLAENQKKSLRDRVIAFEKEIGERINKLQPTLEHDIDQLCKLRSQWVKTITSFDSSDLETFYKRVKILKAKNDLLGVQLMTDVVRLEGYYETHTLNYLIESTTPIDGSMTLEDRDKKLAALTRNNIDELAGKIVEAENYRARLYSEAQDLQFELNHMQLECENHYTSNIQVIRERIAQFIKELKEKSEVANENHRKVMSDYLVLRHNSRVAREVLTRSQQEAASARSELERRLDLLVRDAEDRREKMNAASTAKIKMLTDDIRERVILKELELENHNNQVRVAQKQSSTEVRRLRSSIKYFQKKYKTLQKQRADSYAKVTGELKRLREMISYAEAALYE